LRLLIAVTLLSAAAACGPPPGSLRATLLPDVGPRPRIAALSVNSARRATLRNAELVTNIVNGLPASTRFFILTNDRAAFTVARNDRPDRVAFVDLPYTNPITIWTQDPFLVLAGLPGEITLLTSKEFERADDRLMAEVIARHGGNEYRVRPSGLFFEGGNIVSDLEHIFIGANTIRRNAVELGVAETEVVVRFEEELGRPVLVVGPFPQPVAHIDMIATPLGARRIALADPAAGARIATAALEAAPGSVADFERSVEDHFFGNPAIKEVTGMRGLITVPEVRGRTKEMIAHSLEIAPVLDRVAQSLERYGYQVERIPLLYGGPEDHPEAGDDQTAMMRAAYPMLTYNNVIVEDDVEGKIVYLPRYGWPAMDDAARQAWTALGFTTRPIDGLTISAMYGGALRCSVKVLAR
jgi:hypothetical protein